MKLVSMLIEFGVGDLCVRCGEAVEDLDPIVHHCPAWSAERCEVRIPASALHPRTSLVSRLVHTVWTDGSGGHSSNHTFAGVALATTRTLVKASGRPFGRRHPKGP
eukprot:3600964-Amphidinium_carterae.2